MRPAVSLALLCSCAFASAVVVAQQSPPPPPTSVRAIAAPAARPSEASSAGVTKFAFIAYGDTRSESTGQGDGDVVQSAHSLLVDGMLAHVRDRASTAYPVRFVVSSGDAVLRGANASMWNASFSPVVEKLTRGANIPYFFAVGNHDVTGMPVDDPGRQPGLKNALAAMANLMPPEGSPRRLKGYPTYGVGYGNVFVLAIDSNIASDPVQLSWVTDQLAQLDRARYQHVIAVFHHPPFSSGPHGADTIEPATLAIRNSYLPLFRRHHVRMTITGHDHFLDHFVERQTDNGVTFRRDDVVTGGGGAPLYAYKGEPDLAAYITAGAEQHVRVEHLMKPGATREENPHHFLIIQVDGDRLSLEVVAIGGQTFAPYAGRARIELSDRNS